MRSAAQDDSASAILRQQRLAPSRDRRQLGGDLRQAGLRPYRLGLEDGEFGLALRAYNGFLDARDSCLKIQCFRRHLLPPFPLLTRTSGPGRDAAASAITRAPSSTAGGARRDRRRPPPGRAKQ